MSPFQINSLKLKAAIGAILSAAVGFVNAATAPTLSITSPRPHSRTTNNVISGLVSTNIIDGVRYTIIGRDTGTTVTGAASLGDVTNHMQKWTIDTPLSAGDTFVSVTCSNKTGVSEVSDSFFYRVESPLTLTTGGTGTGSVVGHSIGGAPVPSLTMTNLYLGAPYALTAVPSDGSVFTGWTGSLTNNHATISFVMSSGLVLQANFSLAPKIAIASPKPDIRTNAIVISGTTSANATGVRYWLTNFNNGGQTVSSGAATLGSNTAGTVTWTVAATPLPGHNVLVAQSYNDSGTNSATRNFFYQVTAPLSLNKLGTGHGVLIGAADHAGDPFPPFSTNLYIGESYRLVAVANLDSFFTGWSGSVTSKSPSIDFVMESNLVLNANFSANQFITMAGVYDGLFADTNGVTEASAGTLRGFRVTSSGTGSGRLFVAGQSYGINGFFDRSGDFHYRVVRRGMKTLTIKLHLDSVASDITGTVSDGDFTSELLAHKSASNGTGAFTVVLPSAPGMGYGYLFATNRNGVVILAGALGDGTPVMTSVQASKDGNLPVYLDVYNHSGLVFGNLTLGTNSLTGTLSWIKPGSFTNSVDIVASPYVSSAMLTLPSATLQCAGGDLGTNVLSFNVGVATNTLVDLDGSNAVSGTIDPKSGVLAVKFQSGVATIAGKAVILQTSTNAAGLFLGTNGTGSVLLNWE